MNLPGNYCCTSKPNLMKMSEVNKHRDKSSRFECPTDRRPQIFRPWENRSHNLGASPGSTPLEFSRITNNLNSDGRSYECNKLLDQFTAEIEPSSSHQFRSNIETNAVNRSCLYADVRSNSSLDRQQHRPAIDFSQKHKHKKCRHQILSSSCIHCYASGNLSYKEQSEMSSCCSYGPCFVNGSRDSRIYHESHTPCCGRCQIEAVNDQEVPRNSYQGNWEYSGRFSKSSGNYYMLTDGRSSSMNMQGEHMVGHEFLHGLRRPGQNDLHCCFLCCSTCLKTRNSRTIRVATDTCIPGERNNRTLTKCLPLLENTNHVKETCSSNDTKDMLQTPHQNATFECKTLHANADRQALPTPATPLRSNKLATASNVSLPIVCSTYFNPSETAGCKAESRVVRKARETVLDISEMEDEVEWSEMSPYYGLDLSSRNRTSDKLENSPVIDIETVSSSSDTGFSIFLPKKSDLLMDENNNIFMSNVEHCDRIKQRTSADVKIDPQPANSTKVCNSSSENLLNVARKNPSVFETEYPSSASSLSPQNELKSMECVKGCEAETKLTKEQRIPEAKSHSLEIIAKETSPNVSDLSSSQNDTAYSDTSNELSKCSANLSDSFQISDVDDFCKTDVSVDSNTEVSEDTLESVIDDVLIDIDLMRWLSQNLLGSTKDCDGAQLSGLSCTWSADEPSADTGGSSTFGSCDRSNKLTSRPASNNGVSFRSTRTPVRRLGDNHRRRFQKRFPKPLPRSSRKAVSNEKMLIEAAERFLQDYDVGGQRSCKRKNMENKAIGLKCDCRLNDHDIHKSAENKKVHRGCALLVNPVSGNIEEVKIDTRCDGQNDVSEENVVPEDCKRMEVKVAKGDVHEQMPTDVKETEGVDKNVCMIDIQTSDRMDNPIPRPNTFDQANKCDFRQTVENKITGRVLLSQARSNVKTDRKRSHKHECTAACRGKKITANVQKNCEIAKSSMSNTESSNSCGKKEFNKKIKRNQCTHTSKKNCAIQSICGNKEIDMKVERIHSIHKPRKSYEKSIRQIFVNGISQCVEKTSKDSQKYVQSNDDCMATKRKPTKTPGKSKDGNKVCARSKGKQKSVKRIAATPKKFDINRIVERMANFNLTVQAQKSLKAGKPDIVDNFTKSGKGSYSMHGTTVKVTPTVAKPLHSATKSNLNIFDNLNDSKLSRTVACTETQDSDKSVQLDTNMLVTIDATLSKACRLCGDTFDHENLIKHYMSKHREWCIKCRKQFQSKEARREHVRKNHDVTLFCGSCDVPFVYRSSYRRHLRTEKHLSASQHVKTTEKPATVHSSSGIDDVCTSVNEDKTWPIKDTEKHISRTECTVIPADNAICDVRVGNHSLKKSNACEIGLLKKYSTSHEHVINGNDDIALKEATYVHKARVPNCIRCESISEGLDDESKKKSNSVGKMKNIKHMVQTSEQFLYSRNIGLEDGRNARLEDGRKARSEDGRNARSEDESEPTRRPSPSNRVLNPILDGLLVAGIEPKQHKESSKVTLASLIGRGTTVNDKWKSKVNKLLEKRVGTVQTGSKLSRKVVGETKRKIQKINCVKCKKVQCASDAKMSRKVGRPKGKRIDGKSGDGSSKPRKVTTSMCWVCEKKYTCIRAHLKTKKHKEIASRMKQW